MHIALQVSDLLNIQLQVALIKRNLLVVKKLVALWGLFRVRI
jgi:hypothetical protein